MKICDVISSCCKKVHQCSQAHWLSNQHKISKDVTSDVILRDWISLQIYIFCLFEMLRFAKVNSMLLWIFQSIDQTKLVHRLRNVKLRNECYQILPHFEDS